MKKSFFVFVAGGVIALLAINGTNAQSSVNINIPGVQKNVFNIENVMGPLKNHTIDPDAISPIALKDFAKRYKNITTESWWEIENGFFAKFISNGVRNTVHYNINGEWLFSVKGYSEEKLSPAIRDIVKREYHDYSITYVEEVETMASGLPAYVIHLEDKNNIKLITIRDEQLYVMKEYKKS